jgi:glutamyl-tRNA reductase
MRSMTKKIAISVPDDVAERLAREPNVSAFIADAVRRRMSAERTREALAALGFNITDEDIARAHEERRQLMESVTPELRAKAAAVQAEIERVRANHGAGGKEALERIHQIFHGEPAPMSP